MSFRRLAAGLVAAALVACQAEEVVVPASRHEHPAAVKVSEVNPSELAALRRAVNRFQHADAAHAAGWNFIIPNLDGSLCFESATGAMGFHYADTDLIGDGVIDAEWPEALLYEPQANGQRRLVGVEYIVPIDLWQGEEKPRLYGREFSEVAGFGVYGLHVWIARANPDGLFASYNPTVSCEHAAPTD